MASIEEIATTLQAIVRPGMKPKELRDAVRERHPNAHKKEIVRAAFYALTDAPAAGDAALADLHSFALSERGTEDAESEVKPSKKRRKKDRRKADGHAAR
ncbi:hypothetical protein [Methylobacterium sp. C1]|uniref:hypothetical protein n=1 Tax=Methylobacterium sp. C1 TaxID=1479019 RepID=UPI0008D9A9C2|nr:hypothetical protein [Methylobacterium sp. C1]